MGGIIFIVPTIITIVYLCLSDRVEFTYNLAIVLLVFILYAILGFFVVLLRFIYKIFFLL